MKTRVATVVAMILLIASPAIQADDSRLSRATLKDIGVLSVMVEDLPDSAKTLGISKDTIQTDVELKLRLAGMRIVPEQEGERLLGSPVLYVNLNVADDGKAADIKVEMQQNAVLERNKMWTPRITTWSTAGLVSNPTPEGIRNFIKDRVDEFLNAWLSVNPKK
jgi:hypothetical protein